MYKNQNRIEFKKQDMEHAEWAEIDRMYNSTDICILLKPKGANRVVLSLESLQAILEVYEKTDLFEDFVEKYADLAKTLPLKKKKRAKSYTYKV